MFVSINEPENFSWHDAEIKKVYCQDQDMIWEVDILNVLASNSQNSEDVDLCASTATVIFKNYSIECIKRYGFQKYQWGKLIEEQPDKMLSRQEISVLLEEMIHETDGRWTRYIYGMEGNPDGKKMHISADINQMTDHGDICMEITCDQFIVQWDKFKGKAWYWDKIHS